MIRNKKVIIIAEACDNHFGKYSNAKKMVIGAKRAGADVVKFQHHLPDEEMLAQVPKSSNFKMSLYDFLKKYSLSINDHKKLIMFCKKIGIKYLCTPFSLKAADELLKIKVKWFKVGSGEFTDTPFVKKLLSFDKPTILSTGMSTQDEIQMIYRLIKKSKNKNVALMHCTSEYPPNKKDLNLGFIRKLKKKYPDLVIGHSDHTNDIVSSIGAVAIGAKIIEKHVYLNNKNYGPDKDVSISFSQFSLMVKMIRSLEQSLGSEKKVFQKEKQIRKWATRSLVSLNDIKKNQIIQKKDVWSKRPGTGIPSRFMNKVLGTKAITNIKKNTLIPKKQLKIFK